MPFILKTLPTFPFSAVLGASQSAPDGVLVDLVGKAMTPRQYTAHLDACRLGDAADADAGFDAVKFLAGIVVSADITDEQGQPLPWGQDTADWLLWQCPDGFSPLVQAYRAAALEAARGN